MDRPAERSIEHTLTESDATLRGRKLGDFVLHECIGQGAFAAVYRCEQPLLGREAVIKVLHNRLRGSEVVLQRFMREARLASRLDHPYAAHVYAFGVEPEDGLAWIAMEFVHGTSLERWLEERGPLPPDLLVTFFEHVAEVVQNAHDHGIVHRDLKPSNVMIVERAGRILPKLLDFGIAKMVGDAARLESGPSIDVDELDRQLLPPPADESGSLSLTQANTTLGSPPYMSPEQWCDPLSVGPRSDLYSLAVMAYEALTGTQPFTGPTIAVIADLHCSAPVPELPPKFPVELDRVFRRALAKQPDDRPLTALAFAKELREAVFPPRDPEFSTQRLDRLDRVDSSGQLPTVTVAVQPGPRRKLWPLAVGAGALLASGVTAFALMGGGGEARAGGEPVSPVAEPATPIPRPDPPTFAGPGPIASVPSPPRRVKVGIVSTPAGADVYRMPSEARMGVTPWSAEVPSEEGTLRFVVKKAGYVDRSIEIDLRTGGSQTVKLAREPRRPATPASARSGSGRRKGEPVNPFRSKAP